jgi:hypothetical protein
MDVPFITEDGKQAVLRFCDYASAGNTWSADSIFRVWLPQPLDLANPFAGIHIPKRQPLQVAAQ